MTPSLHLIVHGVELMHQAKLVSMIVYDVDLVHCSECVSVLVDDTELVLTSYALLYTMSSWCIMPLVDDTKHVLDCTWRQAHALSRACIYARV